MAFVTGINLQIYILDVENPKILLLYLLVLSSNEE